MPISRISELACKGVAPPKAQSVKSRGSRPRSISTERSAPIMLVSTIRAIASAVASTSWPSCSATRATAARAAATSSCIAAAEEIVGVDPAQHEVGIGHRRLAAAAAVAGGAGLGAGALRADLEHAALVDPGDRAAASTDRADVDHRDLDRHTPLDLEGGGEALLAADHRRDVGRGAAHVDRDQVVDAEVLRDAAARDHAAGRAREHHVDGRRRGRAERHLAAVRLDDHRGRR